MALPKQNSSPQAQFTVPSIELLDDRNLGIDLKAIGVAASIAKTPALNRSELCIVYGCIKGYSVIKKGSLQTAICPSCHKVFFETAGRMAWTFTIVNDTITAKPYDEDPVCTSCFIDSIETVQSSTEIRLADFSEGIDVEHRLRMRARSKISSPRGENDNTTSEISSQDFLTSSDIELVCTVSHLDHRYEIFGL